MSQPFPEFLRPPIVELVLGVQFNPLPRLTSGHLGWFWKNHLGDDWVSAADAVLLPDQFETFDQQAGWRVATMLVPRETVTTPLRLQIWNRAGDRLIQLQQTSFHYNWRKREETYPSYRKVLAEFEEYFGRFQAFVSEVDKDKLIPNQWQLTYVDSIARGELWQTGADWHNVVPGLLSPTPEIDLLKLEHAEGEWTFEIAPRRGRVHFSVRQVRFADTSETALLVQTTARGPIGKEVGADLKSGLELGHEVAVRAFLRITSLQAHKHWGLRA